MARDFGTGGVESQLPAEPHQDGEGHGGAQVVHGERDPRGPPHHQTRYIVQRTINFVITLVFERNSVGCQYVTIL